MTKKFDYHFNPSLCILFKTYYGLITIEDIETSWEYAFEHNLIPKENKGFILDYRNSHFDIAINDYTAIPQFYKKHLDVFGNFKIAIITQEPKDTVVPVLVAMEDDGYVSKPFSTMEAAIAWVLS
jgi:hypothetical protein